MQMRIPRLTLSHSGSGAPQSAHLSLPGKLRILKMMRYTKGTRQGYQQHNHVHVPVCPISLCTCSVYRQMAHAYKYTCSDVIDLHQVWFLCGHTEIQNKVTSHKPNGQPPKVLLSFMYHACVHGLKTITRIFPSCLQQCQWHS